MPLATTIGTATTWRIAFAALALSFVAAAVLVHVLVPAQLARPRRQHPPPQYARPQLLRAGRTTIIVLSAARFATYTYIEPILLQAGVTPAGISAVLGAAGVAALFLTAPLTDRGPRALTIATMGLIVIALAGLLLL